MEEDEQMRRARFETKRKMKQEELQTQKMETQLLKTEAELRALDQEDQISNMSSIHRSIPLREVYHPLNPSLNPTRTNYHQNMTLSQNMKLRQINARLIIL